MEVGSRELILIHIVALIFLAGGVAGFTNPNDAKVLNDFRNGLENGNLLGWPQGNDPCGPPAWPHVVCSDGRVTQFQAKELGLKGTLPQNLNQLHKLQTIALQKNQFRGKLPSFNGLCNLQSAFLDYNQFDTIPVDFFHGLSSLRVLALDRNPLNQSSGWSIPGDVAACTQLMNFSCSCCNIAGPVPDFFGMQSSLCSLRLSNNRLTGGLPRSFRGSMLKELMLNDQAGGGMTGPIGIIVTMPSLTRVWLHKNKFVGAIPDIIGRLNSLRDLNLKENHLVGLIPQALANMNLDQLDLSSNMFIGPIPFFKAAKVFYNWNSFCLPSPGINCAPEVSALLDFLHDVFYPAKLSSEWTANDPCKGPWWGITCNSNNQVSLINLKNLGLNGTISPSLGHLPGLVQIHLEGNNLNGEVPGSLAQLISLTLLNLSGNAIDPALPKFRDDVKVILDRPRFTPGDPSQASYNPDDIPGFDPSTDKKSKAGAGVVIGAVFGIAVFAALVAVIYFCRKRNEKTKACNGMPEELPRSPDTYEAENLVFSLQVLKKATNNFSQDRELGHGGFGVVYKGVLDDGRKIAVKRMQSGAISNRALDEFQSEITVLSKVRHRHLVSLLGYCVKGNERLLVYEHMTHGALSKHLFRWRKFDIPPLPWAKRLTIALDVARAVQYLHTLAHQSFIHRDLKSANILLDYDFRAKVSDFGLVKLAPDEEKSVATRLAGTFGYLAPEYAVTGKITTKVDVFSFGVILVELLTGLQALDERRPEEQRYLAEWFGTIKSDKEAVIASIDPALDAKEDIHESVVVVAELAGHCIERDANHRPEMGHAVGVLTKLVETWQPCKKADEDAGAAESLPLPLPELLKSWQEEQETEDLSSQGSIPCKPLGLDTFSSADAR